LNLKKIRENLCETQVTKESLDMTVGNMNYKGKILNCATLKLNTLKKNHCYKRVKTSNRLGEKIAYPT
jgi:hypothetical protein